MVTKISKKTKKATYERIIKELDAIFDKSKELDNTARMVTINAMLRINFPDMFFVGFYMVDESKQEKVLKIGPYQGELIVCLEIAYTKGVCGASALQEKIINLPDISKFSGYIACHPLVKSEIVVPVMKRGKLIAVLDIDSVKLNFFDKIDEHYLEYIVDKYFDK